MEPQNISIEKVLKLTAEGIDFTALGDDFILGEAQGTSALSNNRILDMLRYPIRFDGYILFFLKKGHFHIDFNLKTYEVHEGSLLLTVPGNIIVVRMRPKHRSLPFQLILEKAYAAMEEVRRVPIRHPTTISRVLMAYPAKSAEARAVV